MLELRSALQLRGKAEAKELPFVSIFLFSSGEEGGTTYEASPLPLPCPLQPHCTFKGCDSAVAPHVFKFAFLWCGSRRVKFANLKFDYKKSRRSIVR